MPLEPKLYGSKGNLTLEGRAFRPPRGPFDQVKHRTPVKWSKPFVALAAVGFYEQGADSQWDFLFRMRLTAS